jgi:hypothetical protein
MNPATHAIAWSASTRQLRPKIRATSALSPTWNGARLISAPPLPGATVAIISTAVSRTHAAKRLPAAQAPSTGSGRSFHLASVRRVLRIPCTNA